MFLHQHPYRCTSTDCSKTFHSVNEWKYHENNDHYHIQAWHCPMQSDSFHIKICANTLYIKKQFITHLQKNHDIKSTSSSACLEDINPDIFQKAHVSHNDQRTFWCDFCVEVMVLKQSRLNAFDERFDHIIHHFNESKRINSWYPINKNLPIENLQFKQTECVPTMSPTLNKGSTVIIAIKDSNNKKEMNAKKWFKKTRISQNSVVAKMSEGQTDQRNPLSDIEEHLTKGSQPNLRILLKLTQVNQTFLTQKLFADWHVLDFPFQLLTVKHLQSKQTSLKKDLKVRES